RRHGRSSFLALVAAGTTASRRRKLGCQPAIGFQKAPADSRRNLAHHRARLGRCHRFWDRIMTGIWRHAIRYIRPPVVAGSDSPAGSPDRLFELEGLGIWGQWRPGADTDRPTEAGPNVRQRRAVGLGYQEAR